MIRGYNFPSGSEEKVTIDGSKVKENLELVSYSNTIEEEYTSPLLASELFDLGTKHILNDGSLLYLSTISSPFSVTLSYIHYADLEHISSTITIESDNQSGDYGSILHQNSDGKIWLEIRRHNGEYYYFSVYEITINNTTNELSFTNKCLDTQTHWACGPGGVEATLVDSTGIYAVERYHDSAIHGRPFSITTYQFGTSNYLMEEISNFFADDLINSKAFCKAGSTYYFLYSTNYNGYDNYYSVTRNSSNSFSKSNGTLSDIKLFSSLYEYNGYLYGIDTNRNIYQYDSNTWILKNTLNTTNFDMEYTLSGRPYRAFDKTSAQDGEQYNLMIVDLPYSYHTIKGPNLNPIDDALYYYDECSQQEKYSIYYFTRTRPSASGGTNHPNRAYIKLYVNNDRPLLYKAL